MYYSEKCRENCEKKGNDYKSKSSKFESYRERVRKDISDTLSGKRK